VSEEDDQQEQVVSVLYTNHRGITTLRRVIPRRIWFGHTEWHPGEQWLMDVFDLEKRAERSFAIADIKEWSVISDGTAK